MAEHRRAYDYVVVGSGSAGCVLARRLTDGGCSVLLLEAGPRDWSPYIHVPAGLIKAGTYIETVMDSPDPSRDGRQMLWSAGKVFGGGSSVNGMVWTRGHPADFDAWAAMGCEGWGYQDVLPYFMRSERFEGPPSEVRGRSGPVRVGMPRVRHALTDAFLAAAQAAGHEYSEDSNSETLGGISYCQVNQRRGFRHSMARAYLGTPARRRNLHIATDARVTRIVFESGRARGVEFVRRGRVLQVECEREVIVCAGALGSPKLLLLSGIGPARHLRDLGIPVLVDNDQVGADLQEHAVVPMVWNVDQPTFNMDLTISGFLRHGLDFVIRGRGPAALSVGHALLYSSLDPQSGQPGVKALFAPLGVVGAGAIRDESDGVLEGAGEHDVTRMELLRRPSVTAFVSVVHPQSRGAVRLRSADPGAPPEIRMELLQYDEDLELLVRGARDLRRVFDRPPLRDHVIGEALPGPSVQSDHEWTKYARASSHGGQHAVGTCAMGPEGRSVVDSHLRVRGVDGLRVVDASVFPLLTSGHTNAPTVMVAERAADLINP
ncbi:MAG: GMC family oxidoreductase N-terminal domain-containing protein [Actinomycetota bacterium]|nr:GMC family oxidoreductase N-terminal domain-containing protein [Actinomycetota bacterium]